MPSLLESVLAGAHDAVRRYRLRILLAALAILVAPIGLALLVGSVFLRLAESMAAYAAAGVTGGGVLVAAGLMALAAARLGRGRPRGPTPGTATPDSAAGIADLLAAAQAAIGRDARSETPVFALMALLAGCAVGASPQLRGLIADLARGIAPDAR